LKIRRKEKGFAIPLVFEGEYCFCDGACWVNRRVRAKAQELKIPAP
jgi:hypothetical protein